MDDQHDYKNSVNFNQIPRPVKEQFISPFHRSGKVSKSGERVFHVDSIHFAGYRSVVTLQYTILSVYPIWFHLVVLVAISMVSYGATVYVGSHSIDTAETLTTRLQVLLSLVLSAYVGQIIFRWHQIRVKLGDALGSFHSINQLAARLLCDAPNETMIKEKIVRYGRVTVLLLFLACKQEKSLKRITDKGLLEEEEAAFISKAVVTSRMYVVLGWLTAIFDNLAQIGYNDLSLHMHITKQLLRARQVLTHSCLNKAQYLKIFYVGSRGYLRDG